MNRKILIVTERLFEKKEMGSDIRIFNMVNFLEKHNFNINIFYIGTDPDILYFKSKYNLIFDKKQISFKLIIKKIFEKKFFWPFMQKIKNSVLKEYRLNINPKNIKIFEEHIRCRSYDIILFESIDTSYLLHTAKIYNPKAKLVIDTHDIMYKRYLKFKDNKQFSYVLKIYKQEEMDILNKFDLVIAIQNNDYEEIKKELGEDKAILCMHGIEDDIFNSFEYKDNKNKKLKIIFFGGIAEFNYDAIQWFISNVWNDILKSKFELHVFGKICEKLKNNTDNSIILHGKVDNINEVYNDADIAINPIRFGSGLKIKNVEAMSFGIPLITTNTGIEGMKLISSDEIIIANSEIEFEKALISLIDTNYRMIISNKSKQYALDNFSQNSCFKILDEKLSQE